MILPAIILSGLVLRIWLYRLYEEAFYIPQGFISSTLDSSIGQLIKFWMGEWHFPTYYIMLRYWMKVFGTGEFIVLLPSIAAGVASIYVIFLLGRRLFDEQTGLLAGFIFSVSLANMHFAHYGRRPYALVTLFCLLSFLFLHKTLKEDGRSAWAWYAFFTLSCLLLSISALPVLLCQSAFVLSVAVAKRRIAPGARRAMLAILVILAAYIPVLLRMAIPLIGGGHIMQLEDMGRPSLATVMDIFNFLGVKTYREYQTAAMNVTATFLTNAYGICLFFLCLTGIFGSFASTGRAGRAQERAHGLLLGLWLALPILLPILSFYLFSPQGYVGPIRYLLYISPAYYLLVGKGVLFFGGRARAALICLIAVMSIAFMGNYSYIDKWTPWKQIQGYVAGDTGKPGKIVFSFHGEPRKLGEMFHFLGPNFVGLWSQELMPITPEARRSRIPAVRTAEERRKLEDEQLRSIEIIELRDLVYDRFWFLSYNAVLDSEMVKLIERNSYALAEKKEFFDVTLFCFTRKEGGRG